MWADADRFGAGPNVSIWWFDRPTPCPFYIARSTCTMTGNIIGEAGSSDCHKSDVTTEPVSCGTISERPGTPRPTFTNHINCAAVKGLCQQGHQNGVTRTSSCSRPVKKVLEMSLAASLHTSLRCRLHWICNYSRWEYTNISGIPRLQ